jgi:hypothetical protein
MPGPVNTIYTRDQRVHWRYKYCTREDIESGGAVYTSLDLHDTAKQQQASSQQLSIASPLLQGEESEYKRRPLNPLPSSIN